MLKVENMRLLLFVFLAVLCSCASSSNAIDPAETVQQAVGELVISHDKNASYLEHDNPFGSAVLFEEFIILYHAKIQGLSLEHRVNFLWAVMWHMDFDGHSMLEFQKIIANDCGVEFLSRLERYIDKEVQLSRNRSRLFLSQKVYVDLKELVENG